MNQNITDTIINFMNLHQLTRSKLIKPAKSDNNIINHSQRFIMLNLKETGIQSMSSICERTGISNQQMTKLVDDLVKLNFLSRNTNKDNRRQNLVDITEEGDKFLKQQEIELVQNSISQFGTFTDSDLAILNKDIKEIISIINK